MLSEERVERYELLGELATGGMATVYLGRQRGPFGFSRTVAIKSMHPQFAKDEDFRAMFLDEAMLTARIRHPNVVPTLDIVCADTKVLIVMEYIDGVPLSTLLRVSMKRNVPLPPAIAVAILADVLHGLHAAHELTDDGGQHLAVVHRDVSPQNIHVGVDGLARVLDFGVAKAASRRYVTQSGEIKGKLAYMSSEQLCGEPVDRRTDIYAAGVVLWETLTNRRLVDASNEGELVKKVLEGKFDPPSFIADTALTDELDRLVLKALSLKAEDRWSTSEEMANALSKAVTPASRAAITAIVKDLAGEEINSRASRLREGGTPISKELEPEAKALLNVLTEHATVTSAGSATRPEPARPRAGRPVFTIAVGLVLVAAITGTAFVVGSQTAKGTSSRVAREPPSAQSSVAMATSVAIPSSAPPIPEPAPPPTTSTTASATARPRTNPKKPPVVAHPPARPNCNPPFTVDANGDRHYKPECVE